MRASSLIVAIALVSACFTGGTGEAAPPVSTRPAEPAKLRIKPVAQAVGSVRVEATATTEGGIGDERKVKRITVLALDGLIVTRAKITYLAASGDQAPLEGKSFIVAIGDGETAVSPTDGGAPGDEDLVRKDNKSFGKLDSTIRMISKREFVVGAPVEVPAPDSVPANTSVTMTLRSFDASIATFDMTVVMKTDHGEVKAKGRTTIDRKTGLDRSATMTIETLSGRQVRRKTLEFQATTE
jgi:hypothetical protein